MLHCDQKFFELCSSQESKRLAISSVSRRAATANQVICGNTALGTRVTLLDGQVEARFLAR